MILLSVIVPTLDGALPESVRRACARDDRVEVVPVVGVRPVGRARNVGLSRAKGDYIAWVDSDDEITEAWLPSVLESILKSPDVITFDADLVGYRRREHVWGEKHPDMHKLITAVYHDVRRMSSMWLYVTRRELWEGLRFREDICVLEDFALLPSLLKKAKSVIYVKERLYRYHKNERSLLNTHGVNGDQEVFRLKCLRDIEAGAYQSADRFVMGFAYYLVIARVACGCAGYRDDVWAQEAARGRAWIRRNWPGLMVDTFFRVGLPPKERFVYGARFVSALTNFVSLVYRRK